MSRKSKNGRSRASSAARTELAALGPEDAWFWNAPWSGHPKVMPEVCRTLYQTIDVRGGGQETGIRVELHEVMTLPGSWAEYVGRVVRLICAAVADLNGVSQEEVARQFVSEIVDQLLQQLPEQNDQHLPTRGIFAAD